MSDVKVVSRRDAIAEAERRISLAWEQDAIVHRAMGMYVEVFFASTSTEWNRITRVEAYDRAHRFVANQLDIEVADEADVKLRGKLL